MSDDEPELTNITVQELKDQYLLPDLGQKASMLFDGKPCLNLFVTLAVAIGFAAGRSAESAEELGDLLTMVTHILTDSGMYAFTHKSDEPEPKPRGH